MRGEGHLPDGLDELRGVGGRGRVGDLGGLRLPFTLRRLGAVASRHCDRERGRGNGGGEAEGEE